MVLTSKEKEYTIISIKDLIFSESVADAVDNYQEFPEELMNNIQDDGTFALDQKRLNSVMIGYQHGLPPVTVEKALGGKFTLLNGRHRLCAAILNGDTSIQAQIV